MIAVMIEMKATPQSITTHADDPARDVPRA